MVNKDFYFKPYSYFELKAKALDRSEIEKELVRYGVQFDIVDETEFLRERLARLYSHEGHLHASH